MFSLQQSFIRKGRSFLKVIGRKKIASDNERDSELEDLKDKPASIEEKLQVVTKTIIELEKECDLSRVALEKLEEDNAEQSLLLKDFQERLMVNGNEQDIGQLTILDIASHLKDISNVEYIKKNISDGTYFDLVSYKYKQALAAVKKVNYTSSLDDNFLGYMFSFYDKDSEKFNSEFMLRYRDELISKYKDRGFDLAKTIHDCPYLISLEYINSLRNKYEEVVLRADINSFHDSLKEVFNSEENKAKLLELGASELDLAFINNDLERAADIMASNPPTTPYELAKQTRFLANSKDFKCILDNKEILVQGLNHLVFVYNADGIDAESTKTLLIDMIDDGIEGDRLAWSYDDSASSHKNQASYFDKVFAYGSGNHDLSLKAMIGLLKHENISRATQDLAVVRLRLHGSEKRMEALKEFIDAAKSLANDTLYILESCYSGQYHELWDVSKGCLITSASFTNPESSNGLDSKNGQHFAHCLKEGKPSIESFLKFYAQYKLSTPCFSGVFKGQEFYGTPIKEVCDSLDINIDISEVERMPAASLILQDIFCTTEDSQKYITNLQIEESTVLLVGGDVEMNSDFI